MAKAATKVAPPTDPAPIIKERSLASNINLSFFGIMNVAVDLFPTEVSDRAVRFSLGCPSCDSPVKLTQQYVCPEDGSHGPFTTADASRVKEINGILYKVSDEEIEGIKEPSLPPGDATVSVFPAAQVEASTRPTGKAYRLRPRVASALPIYAMVRDLVANPEYAFVLELTLRNNQKMYRVETWNSQLVIQELLRPDEVRAADVIDASYDGKLLATATTLAETQVEDFDPAAFRNAVRERAQEFERQKAAEAQGVPLPAKAKVKAASKGDDAAALLASLEAAVAASKSKKK